MLHNFLHVILLISIYYTLILLTIDLNIYTLSLAAFTALMLLVKQQKGIRPVKNWVVGCWHGYVSGSRCKFANGPTDATANYYLSLQ